MSTLLQLLIVVGSSIGKGSVRLSASHLHRPPKTFIGFKKQRKIPIAFVIIH